VRTISNNKEKFFEYQDLSHKEVLIQGTEQKELKVINETFV
jgi:hypothetical protein